MVMDVFAVGPNYHRTADPYVNVKFDNSANDSHPFGAKLKENYWTSTYIPKVLFGKPCEKPHTQRTHISKRVSALLCFRVICLEKEVTVRVKYMVSNARSSGIMDPTNTLNKDRTQASIAIVF